MVYCSPEADALLWVKMRGFRDQSFNTAHTSVHHVDGHFANGLRATFLPEFLHSETLNSDFISKHRFKVLKMLTK